MSLPILTRRDGTVIERPAPPTKRASIEERIDHLRAVAAFNDEVADTGGRAFNKAFGAALKRKGSA